MHRPEIQYNSLKNPINNTNPKQSSSLHRLFLSQYQKLSDQILKIGSGFDHEQKKYLFCSIFSQHLSVVSIPLYE